VYKYINSNKGEHEMAYDYLFLTLWLIQIDIIRFFYRVPGDV